VESFHLLPVNGLQKPAPKVTIVPPRAHDRFDSLIPSPVSPEYAWKLIPLMLAAIDGYGQKLSLPIPKALTTSNVARIEVHNNEGWPHAEVTLTNGWRFVYRHTMVNGYYAPDNFFDSDNRKIHIRDFEGKWNLTTNQAIEVVRKAISKLNYPTNNVHMDFAPTVYPASVDKEHIPRLRFEWYYSVHDELQSRLEAEVNTESGKLESLYYDDKAYWGSRPPIDVPITLSNKTGYPQ
jgi:nitrogen fixation protein